MLSSLPATRGRGDDRVVHVVVECPRGSNAKLKLDPDLNVMTLGRTLPVGVVFPFDFGFVPSTHAEDGDPLDAMIITEASTYPGVVVPCRPIGILKASQKGKKGEKRRRRVMNDRVLFVPESDERSAVIHDVKRDLPARLRKEVETFFEAAVALEDKELRILGWGTHEEAWKAIEKAMRVRVRVRVRSRA
jgi:inorganic pyrophosphatase